MNLVHLVFCITVGGNLAREVRPEIGLKFRKEPMRRIDNRHLVAGGRDADAEEHDGGISRCGCEYQTTRLEGYLNVSRDLHYAP